MEAKVGKMIALLQECLPDAEKARKGNVAAGTRLRDAMQQVKGLAQDVREEVLAVRHAKKS